AEPPIRQVLDGEDAGLGVGLEGSRADDVRRQLDVEVERVLDAQLLGHLAADEHGVGTSAEVLEDAELVLHPRATRDEDEGPLDLAEQLAEVAQLLFQE